MFVLSKREASAEVCMQWGPAGNFTTSLLCVYLVVDLVPELNINYICSNDSKTILENMTTQSQMQLT